MTKLLGLCLGVVSLLVATADATPHIKPELGGSFRLMKPLQGIDRLTGHYHSVLGEQQQISLSDVSSSASQKALNLRGGASSCCMDSDASLFVKVGIGAVMEAAAMLGVIVATKALSETLGESLPSIAGLSVLQWLGLLVIIFASSFIGSIVDGSLSAATMQVLDPNMVPGDSDWYAKLTKPSWNPPGWVFPIMWLIVSKPTQLLAVSRILKQSTSELPLPILFVYTTHLALGDAWNKVFFGLQCTGRGAAVITAFFGLLLSSAYLFGTLDPTAGKLMLPTCGWVLVATALNWNIYLNNK